MKVRVTIGTTYCGCPSESFEIECDSVEDFMKNDEYSTEILNAINNGDAPHYFINYDWDENDDDEENDDYDNKDFDDEESEEEE